MCSCFLTLEITAAMGHTAILFPTSLVPLPITNIFSGHRLCFIPLYIYWYAGPWFPNSQSICLSWVLGSFILSLCTSAVTTFIIGIFFMNCLAALAIQKHFYRIRCFSEQFLLSSGSCIPQLMLSLVLCEHACSQLHSLMGGNRAVSLCSIPSGPTVLSKHL